MLFFLKELKCIVNVDNPLLFKCIKKLLSLIDCSVPLDTMLTPQEKSPVQFVLRDPAVPIPQ